MGEIFTEIYTVGSTSMAHEDENCVLLKKQVVKTDLFKSINEICETKPTGQDSGNIKLTTVQQLEKFAKILVH